ncbi:MAG: ParB/RepB/Spo0J family partition protein [Janthinobacterium lividum]
MSRQKDEAARLAAAAIDPSMLPSFSRRAPRVAMNTVTDFTGELGKVENDLREAREKLALHEGSLPTRKIDPRTIKLSKFANRIDQSLEGADFEAFKQEIANAGGNVQPIKVRLTEEGVQEVVFGHRRYRACLELGLPVLATIRENMTDKELFEEMSRENDQRKNLSPYELAMHYKRAIDLKLYRNWSEVAAVLGKTKALLSRYSALAELPKAVVDAFPSPNDIQPKWATTLRRVIDVDADAVVQAAKKARGSGLNAKLVFEMLINLPEKELTRVNFAIGGWIETDRTVRIDIDKSRLTPEQLEELQAYLVRIEAS